MNPLFAAYGFLAAAIVFELAGTTFLQKSNQFTNVGATLALVVFYAGSFYFLSHALKTMPLGVAYAIWGGLGIVLSVVVSVLVFKQSIDWPAIAGIAMIVSGVVVLNVFSKTLAH